MRTHKKYLSIDMDFWNGKSPTCAYKNLRKIIQELKRRRVPIKAVMNHQQLLQHVDRSHATMLINIDKHSDLYTTQTRELNCGSWISYVKWRSRGVYRWIHGHSIADGECASMRIFTEHGDIDVTHTDWDTLERHQVSSMPDINFLVTNCVEAGLVLSPQYVSPELEPVFRNIVKNFNIPYAKGRRNEHFGIQRRPPIHDSRQ